MNTIAVVADIGYVVEHVMPPKNDKTATGWAFDAPYRRVRYDGQGYYINSKGKRVSVVIAKVRT